MVKRGECVEEDAKRVVLSQPATAALLQDLRHEAELSR